MIEANNVIAFASDSITEINALVSKLDARLFLFADYEPKSTDKVTSYRLLFLTNVINTYALFYDCGKILQVNILAKWNDSRRPDILRQLAQIHLSPYYNLLDLVAEIRNSSFHNMNCKYYNNNSNLTQYRSYLALITGDQKDIHEYSEKDWKNINLDFYNRCAAAEVGVREYIVSLNSISDIKEKEDIVHYWLENIKRWYIEENKHMLDHTICSYFAPKAYPKRMNTGDARLQLGIAWNRYKRLRVMNYKDATNNYYLECENRISILLSNETLCPAPALPMEFYKVLTGDLRHFA